MRQVAEEMKRKAEEEAAAKAAAGWFTRCPAQLATPSVQVQSMLDLLEHGCRSGSGGAEKD